MTAKPPTLGSELQRLRTAAGFTLRKFADKVGISAAHQSDIEHDRRRPSPELLTRLATHLRHVGADPERLSQLDTRLSPDVRDWMAETPEARQMLRAVRNSGRDPKAVLKQLEELLKRDTPK